MQSFRAFILMISLSGAAAAQTDAPLALSAGDKLEIGSTIASFVVGWNGRDMAAFGRTMTEDCDWVNVVGMHWKGREQVVRAHTKLLQTRYKGVNVHSLSHQETLLAPDLALVLWSSSVDDFTTSTGQRVVGTKDLATLVMVKQGAHWLIRSAQNTTIDAKAAMHDPGK